MKTTITIDDELYLQAHELTDNSLDDDRLVKEVLETYIRIKTANKSSVLAEEEKDAEESLRG